MNEVCRNANEIEERQRDRVLRLTVKFILGE